MSKHAPRFLKIFVWLAVIIAVSGYVFFNTRLFIEGPQIVIDDSYDGSVFNEKLIHINGKVFNSSFISINDRPISIDEQGNFSERILLQNGYNIISIKANDKFERQVTETLDLVYNVKTDGRDNSNIRYESTEDNKDDILE